ncbi:MAG TPA: flagellar basal body-associated FliL family protein [Pseudomonas sp.]|nr:flagellar basal body-associated FliL family protein [Pseudomonas sp.]
MAKVEKKKLLIIIAGALVLLLAMIAAVGITWYVLTSSTPSDAPVDARPLFATRDRGAVYEELKEPFVVNFNANGRARYLQVSVSLLGRDKKAMETLREHQPMLRNELVMLFSAQSFEAMLTAAGKEAVREQATERVQEIARNLLGKPAIEQVLFTNFVLQ